MDAAQLFNRLVRGNEFKNEDSQYLYTKFCKQWKVHLLKVVNLVLQDTTENCKDDFREYFQTHLMFGIIYEIENFTLVTERKLDWGIWINKIAETLSIDLQVETVYKVSL